MVRVLVAYATKYRSTAEIADEIGKTLQTTEGLEVDVREVSTVTDLKPYQAVVLGSAVYVGQWQPEAVDFLVVYEADLARLPVWLFSSGPTGEGAPQDLTHGWTFPLALRPVVERIAPQGIVLFHGNVKAESLDDPENLNWGQRFVLKVVHPPVGDFRDWMMIDDWAASIAQALKSSSFQTG